MVHKQCGRYSSNACPSSSLVDHASLVHCVFNNGHAWIELLAAENIKFEANSLAKSYSDSCRAKLYRNRATRITEHSYNLKLTHDQSLWMDYDSNKYKTGRSAATERHIHMCTHLPLFYTLILMCNAGYSKTSGTSFDKKLPLLHFKNRFCCNNE